MADNFGVAIFDPLGGPGAAAVGEVLLTPTSASNYANLAGGMFAGDLTGDFILQQSTGGAGGKLTGTLQVNGRVDGVVSIPVIDAADGGCLKLNGGIGATARIAITERITDALLLIAEDIPDSAELVFHRFQGDARVQLTTDGVCQGLIELPSGIESTGATLSVAGVLDAPGRINLLDQVVAGNLLLYGGDGDILNGGVVSGAVQLATTGVFSGSAGFSAIAATGFVDTELGAGTADLEGVLSIDGDVDGAIRIRGGDLTPAGQILVGGDLNGQIKVGAGGLGEGGNLFGAIAIAGDVNGPSTLGPSIWVDGGDLGGTICIGGSLNGGARIAVTGSFLDSVETPEIDIAGSIDELAAVVIDYDGWQSGDVWESGATLRVGNGDPLERNTPAERVWEIQPCRGDMNNDGVVNVFDIDPFILALSDEEGYQEAFPGLEASRVYHGDCNCSDALNNFDIDPFVARVIANECSATCGDSLTGGNDGGENNRNDSANPPNAPTAEAVAALLRENTANERQNALLIVVAAAADSDDAATATFWTTVLAVLVE